MVGSSANVGFLRQKVSEDRLLASTCVFCQRMVAATADPKLLAFIERIHCCTQMQRSRSYP